MNHIYLDAAATTKPYPQVIETMAGVAAKYWANPSSNYTIADEARTLIENVRQQFANDLNCSPEELIFTSSGCESNSLALAGFLKANAGYALYTSKLEHASINETIENLSAHQARTEILNKFDGIIDPDALEETILFHREFSGKRPFVSISAANSEIGAIQDIKTLAAIVHKYNGIIHCDAVQLFPEQSIDVKDWDVDMLSISAQKFHGPRGVGLLYVKDGTNIAPIIYGSQENHRRGGTYNTAAICGAGKALELTRKNNTAGRIQSLRDSLLDKLLRIPHAHLNGPQTGAQRLANNISLTIDGVNAERLMTMCDMYGVIISKGSACQSHEPTPSKALLAIGLTHEQALSTIRITLDEFNTVEEINKAADIITKLVERMRAIG